MTTIRFRDQDFTMNLKPDEMSFGEMEEMERALGMPWGQIEARSSGENVSMAVIRAMMWTALRRQLPDLAFEETAAITMADLELGDPDPLEPSPPSTAPPE